ncbi:calcium/sodium antiporter [Candidatus Woesearchaeota archaeon]|nr:calcium/sodium antiporter [Candidatus Woesearchaeota archaeon]
MALLLWIIILIVALFVLIKSADYFTDSAEKIGLYFGMPAFLVGVTIVALGTSIPELATSLVSVFRDSSEIVIGNVVGSNIANILLILGLAALIGGRILLKNGLNRTDKIFLVVSAVLLFVFGSNGFIVFWEALILLLGYIIYMFIIIYNHKKVDMKVNKLKWEPFILVISAVFIYFSANYTVKSIIGISELIGFGKEVIAASAVAFGTSLPELTVSLTAVKRGSYGIAVGNILGSNIFNALVVLGVSGMFVSLPVTPIMATLGMFIMLVATGLFLFVLKDNRITRWEGVVLVLIYLFFLIKLFNLF